MASGSLRNCIARFALLFRAVGCIWLILHSTEHYRNDHNGIVSLNCPLVVIELTGEKKLFTELWFCFPVEDPLMFR